MTSSRILFPQFRDEQRDSKYPFADSATLTSGVPGFLFDRTMLVDAVFYPIGGGDAVFLSEITVAETKISFLFETISPQVFAAAEYDWREPPDNSLLPVLDTNGRPAGALIINPDKLRELSGWPPGVYPFAPGATTFAATTFIPAQEPGVRALKTTAGDFMTNDVWLIGDAGVVLRFEEPNIIRVDIVGVPLFRRFACADAAAVFPPKRFIKTINGCPPDEYGNFTITATDSGMAPGNSGTVLRVYPTTSGLVIEAVGGRTT